MDEARQALVTENIKLAYFVANSFDNTGHHIDDLRSACFLGLVKAAHSFDVSKGIQFATYATKCMQNEVLMFLRINKKHLYVDRLEGIITTDVDGHVLKYEDVVGEEDSHFHFEHDIQNKFISKLHKRDQQLIALRMRGLTQKECAERLGISQSYISRIFKKLKVRYEKIYNS
jgi:RNA polymerase sporulation-specific sigma factor